MHFILSLNDYRRHFINFFNQISLFGIVGLMRYDRFHLLLVKGFDNRTIYKWINQAI